MVSLTGSGGLVGVVVVVLLDGVVEDVVEGGVAGVSGSVAFCDGSDPLEQAVDPITNSNNIII